ncbi:MAG TPA: penicillin-binding protein activator [Rhizomicrobium sp.]|jgi:ABC-type branched-subunit amino acid transport system substrate-binding protein
MKLLRPICAIAAALAIAALAGCVTPPVEQKPAPPPAPTTELAPIPPATHPMLSEEPGFLRLPNLPADKTPVRVGLLLPFSNGSSQTRSLATAMMKAAQLALFDAGNPNIILISADEGSTPESAANGARSLLAQGAEVIVGPLFSASVSAVAPIAHDRAVPVISFSTDVKKAGNGVYLLSFQPENEVRRTMSYAVQTGHKHFAALVPPTAYGNHIADAIKEDATALGADVADIERLEPANQAAALHKIAISDADVLIVAAGGNTLRELAPALAENGIDRAKIKLMGTGLWDDPSITRETALEGGWFAAPAPDVDSSFNTKYRAAFGTTPPQLASLAYDAVSLMALLSKGEPYHRFTDQALTDPNGFAGVDGILRFAADGTSERGLAILAVEPDGFRVIDPSPRTFEKPAEPPPKTTSSLTPRSPQSGG